MRDQLLKKHQEAEDALRRTHAARRQHQVHNLQEKMAQRRKRRFDKLRDEQEARRNEVN